MAGGCGEGRLVLYLYRLAMVFFHRVNRPQKKQYLVLSFALSETHTSYVVFSNHVRAIEKGD